MSPNKIITSIGVLLYFASIVALAQADDQEPKLTPVSQEQIYDSSWEEYEARKEQAKGGTQHTADTLPDWSGLWTRKARIGHAFDDSVEGRDDLGAGTYGTVTVPLTPAYQKDYEEQLQTIRDGHEWDRLSYCLPAGFPRWLTEPWLREMIPTPNQTWLSHEQVNETRRIYTDGRGHIPEDEAIPLWLGDSIGFWDEDTLVIHTKNLKAGYYQRGQPAYSFETSTVELWRKVDENMIEVDITVYDPPALVKPWHAKFRYGKVTDPSIRVNYASCIEGNNVVRLPEGGTGYLFPWDPGYQDPATFGIPEVTLDTLPE